MSGVASGSGRPLDEAKRDAIDELHGDITEIEALSAGDEDDDDAE